MRVNQRVRSEACWALSLLSRKRSEKREVLGATEGDLGAMTTERAGVPRLCAQALGNGLGFEFLIGKKSWLPAVSPVSVGPSCERPGGPGAEALPPVSLGTSLGVAHTPWLPGPVPLCQS